MPRQANGRVRLVIPYPFHFYPERSIALARQMGELNGACLGRAGILERHKRCQARLWIERARPSWRRRGGQIVS
jgi:hypothetical protein